MDDLSAITAGVVGGSSMGASNTISVPPPFNPAGSESEATEGITVHSTPEPVLGAAWQPGNRVQGDDDASAGFGWQYVQGVNHG